MTIRTQGCCFVHASDTQGPVEKEPLQIILRQKPDAVIVGGPPLYLAGFRIDRDSLSAALNNITTLVREVPLTVVDHHLLRSLDYKEYLAPALASAERCGHRLFLASELVGAEPNLLEAMRKELHAKEPVNKEWYAKLTRDGVKIFFS